MLLLTTERLVLREFVEADWPAMHEYAADPEVGRHLAWGPNSEDETRAYLREIIADQRQEPRTRYDLAVALRDTGRLIGSCGLHVSGERRQQGEMGYILHQAFWGRGYTTEAARELLRFGFEDLRLHRVTATCEPTNLASARVLEKLGMRREGHFREHMWARDHWRDSFFYALLDREWRQPHPPAASPAAP